LGAQNAMLVRGMSVMGMGLGLTQHRLLATKRCFTTALEGQLSGKVGVVTGASSGIGLAVSRALAADGMRVIMVARNQLKLQAAAESIPGAISMPCDVVNRSATHTLIDKVIQQYEKVDVLANCAGVMYFTLLRNLHYQEWEDTIDVNCKGVVNMSGAVLPKMVTARSGHIINISSDAAKQLFPALAVYNASKAFVNIFSKSLRAECVGTGIRVTDVQPGDTATDLIMRNTDTEAAGKVGVDIGSVVGVGFERASILDPSDIASAVLYAIKCPGHVGIHEILIEPRDQMFGDPTQMGITPDGMYGPGATGPDPKQ